VNDDENGASHAGEESDDELSPSEVVRSLSQECKAQVAKWAQMPVGAAQAYEGMQRAFANWIAFTSDMFAERAAVAARVDDAYPAVPESIRELLDSMRVTMKQREALRNDEQKRLQDSQKRIVEHLSANFGSAPGGYYYPSNWWSVPQLDGDVATAIMQGEGIPLAWVPRAETVADLIAAPDAATRDTILVARTPDIVEDCRQRLAEVLDADLQHLEGLIDDALRALEQSIPTAAQALAANVFDTLLRDVRNRGRLFAGSTGRFKYKHVTSGITPVSDETLIGLYRATCVLTPVLMALDEFNFETDPVPGRFRRHATAHRAGTTQYTPANAIIAVMLATSLLREAQESGW
jgi:hypothetical protein